MSVIYVSPDRQLDDMLQSVKSKSEELSALADSLRSKLKALTEPDRSMGIESVVDALRNMNEERPYTGAELGVIMESAIRLPEGGLKGTAEEVDELAVKACSLRQSSYQDVVVDRLCMSASMYAARRIREFSAALKILPPEEATKAMLTYDESEMLRIVWEKEPDAAAAKWVPPATVPEGKYITSDRYSIPLARIMSPDYREDREYILTGRKKLHELVDRGVKDMACEIDIKFFTTVNGIVFESDEQGKPNHVSGKIQWRDLPATVDGFKEATSMLPTGNKYGRFVCRNFTVAATPETIKAMLEAGIDISHYGMNLVEIPLVSPSAYGSVYFFTEPLFLGKSFRLGDLSGYFKAEAFTLSGFLYWLLGFAFGNTAGMAIARFDLPKCEKKENDK